MATEKKALSIYVSQELADRIGANALADGRTLSNYVERLLEQTLPVTKRHVVHEQRTADIAMDTRLGRQLDLETAIAQAVKRGPVAKHKKRGPVRSTRP